MMPAIESGCDSARSVVVRGARLSMAGVALAVGAALGAIASPAYAQTSIGTWTRAPANPSTGGAAFGLWLLTDGTVLSHGRNLNNWVILTPDSKGSYANGTWKTVASSNYARGGAQEHVLNDGRFFEAGGEYIYTCPSGVSNCSSQYNTVEIFDPQANTWTLEAPGLFGDIGDTGSATLSDGRILESYRNSNKIQIYDPKTNTWTQKSNGALANGDENAWAELQNGGVLAVGYANDGAAVYDPSSDKWTRTTVPSGFDTGDTGGISLMFDGRVFVYGLSGKSYIYTPGATAQSAGTWAAGPAMLDGGEAEDEYSDTLPNGLVVGALVQMTYGPGVVWQAFDPTTNTVSSVTPPPDPGNPYPISYVNLPNGQVMVDSEAADGPDWILTLSTGPEDAWRPTVTSVVYDGNDTYTLTGTQISGLINGGDEGDDMTMQENYPIVWLTDSSGNVHYCRTFNISSMTPSKGSTPETCDFTTPANLPAGTYSLYVSAVGVPSKDPFPFTTGQSSSGSSSSSPSGSSSSSSGSTSSSSAAGSTSIGTASSVSTSGGTGSGGNIAKGSGSASTSVASTATGGATSTGPAGASPGSTSSSPGCGCHAAGSGDRSGGVPAVVALAGAVLVGRRRRRGEGGAERAASQK
jgi:MYXO-CTERM domain-containing protein